MAKPKFKKKEKPAEEGAPAAGPKKMTNSERLRAMREAKVQKEEAAK